MADSPAPSGSGSWQDAVSSVASDTATQVQHLIAHNVLFICWVLFTLGGFAWVSRELKKTMQGG